LSKLYARIEDLCKQKGVNITKMCADAGVTRGALTDLKMGRSQSLSMRSISKIATYFDVSTDFLLREDDNTKIQATESVVISNGNNNNVHNNPPSKMSTELNSMEQEFLEHFRNLDMQFKYKVLSYLYAVEAEQKRFRNEQLLMFSGRSEKTMQELFDESSEIIKRIKTDIDLEK